MIKNIVVLCITIVSAQAERPFKNYDNSWPRTWFPFGPNDIDSNSAINNIQSLSDLHHGVAMGIINSDCDDGKSNLEIDWNNNEENYTCFENKRFYAPNSSIHPFYSPEPIPKEYSAQHKCMNESIQYDQRIPTFGTHRPLWAKYGEYKFLPRQRWLHNLEHGAIVMLYHPCANRNEVSLLSTIIRLCLYRHIITPYTFLTSQKPLAVVAWGHRLEISKVAPNVVIEFIQKYALKGPEKTYKNGQYDYMLKDPARIVSDKEDTSICPNIKDFFEK